ncbi:MAG: hypothetical protein JXA49_05680 [Actinobacteria bacterium]|nr:hypothetical protein [Actinomycetota bacterium]
MAKHSLTTGLSFGLTSGVITTMGLMVGLHSGTNSKIAVLGGIMTIAVADAFSDALGIHVSEESENVHTTREIWESTIFTFIAKFLFSSIFIVPVLLLNLSLAVMVSVAMGLLIIGAGSYFMARNQDEATWKVVAEHLTIAAVVVVLTHYVGELIAAVCC